MVTTQSFDCSLVKSFHRKAHLYSDHGIAFAKRNTSLTFLLFQFTMLLITYALLQKIIFWNRI